MSVPPVFPTAYYKILVEGAKKLGVSRAQFALDAARHYLKTLDKKEAPLAKELGSEELAERYRQARSNVAKKWWSLMSEEEKRERAKKAIQARWGKKEK